MTVGEQRLGLTSSLRAALGYKKTEKPPLRIGEVKHWLAALRSDPWYQIEPVPYTAPAFIEICGISKQSALFGAYGMTRSGNRIGAHVVASIQPIMDRIEAGEVVFIRRGKGPWEAIPLARPLGRPPMQPRLVERPVYNWWGCCVACKGRRYAPVLVNGQPHAACWHCIPPQHYKQVAAQPHNRRLVARWLPAEYRGE